MYLKATGKLLAHLYMRALLENDDKLGSTILWNAMYHMESNHGQGNRIPSFNQQWHSGMWWQ